VSRRVVQTVAVTAAAVASTTLAGCDTAKWSRGAMPVPITKGGHITLALWQGTWVAALIVGVLVWGLIIWAVIRFRRKQGDGLPKQTRYNIPIELFYTIAPTIMIAVLFGFTVKDQTELTRQTGAATNHVTVVGYQWEWTFNYTDKNAYDVGSTAQRPTLWLPVNQRVAFTLESPDVIHSFWVPDFLFHMDVVPGRKNIFEVTPDTIGDYKGRCAELCGAQHSRMLFNVKVVSQKDYDAHIAALRAAGQTGTASTGRYHLNTDTAEVEK